MKERNKKMENSQNKKEIKINFWSYVAAIIITIIIFGGVIWWFNNDNKSVQNKTHINKRLSKKDLDLNNDLKNDLKND